MALVNASSSPNLYIKPTSLSQNSLGSALSIIQNPMQIGATLPSQNLLFQTRRNSFNCRQQSTLNPTIPRPTSNPTSLQFTKHTIANLDKLLGKNDPQPIPDYQEPVKRGSSNGSSLNRSKGMLEALNMVRVWPEMKAAEEMSPRHLNRLQRLLSMKSEYSPRNHLGSRWVEYHGSNDWTGLIDPLDENLRREVVRYGEFIQAAYHAFHSNPAMSASEPPPPQHVSVPDRNFKVTKSLYATSSVGLPKWVDDVAPDLGWMTQRSSWIGYVAVCDDMREIQRMGRREIVISLRGTSTCMEWAENVRAQLVDVDGDATEPNGLNQSKPKVGCGFLSLYKTKGAHVESLAESVVEEVKRLMEQYKGETLSISVTGHSLGAALALLVAHDLSKISSQVPPIAVYSFGGPKVGNKGFGNLIKSENVKVLRIVNNQDVITRVPAFPVVEDDMAYSHVGSELRLDTKMSPFLKPNADVACCHDLEAYLHLVDGFVASNCPFRAHAKRSIAKLMNEQRSNVKKLYTSKAKALSLNLERPGLHTPPTCLPSPSSS